MYDDRTMHCRAYSTPREKFLLKISSPFGTGIWREQVFMGCMYEYVDSLKNNRTGDIAGYF